MSPIKRTMRITGVAVTVLSFVTAMVALSKAGKEPSSQDEEIRGRHLHTEAIYWDARAKAEENRKQLPPSAFTGSVTDLGAFRRIWDYFTPDYNCPLLKERVGRIGDGGKWVCGLRSNVMHGRRCLVYSLGSAGDTSFEDALLSSTGCEVHTFDPTLPETLQAAIGAKPGLHFHSIGVGGHSAAPVHGQTAVDSGKMRSLEIIMADLDHTWVDILKMDIEMHEWGLFLDYYKEHPGAKLPATQLLIEFHFPGEAAKVWEVLDLITADNYRIFSVEPNWYCNDGCCARDLVEFAFIKVTKEGQICAPIHHGGGVVVLPPGC